MIDTTTKAQYAITQTAVESYKFKHPSGMYWADITVDENPKGGRIQIASDFGNWAYYWNSAPFKDFLCGLGISLPLRGKDAADKFGCDQHFDFVETIAFIRKAIREHGSEYEHKAKLAKEANTLENEGYHYEEFCRTFDLECPLLREMFEFCAPVQYCIAPGFRKFWQMVWPLFVAELKKEKVEETIKHIGSTAV